MTEEINQYRGLYRWHLTRFDDWFDVITTKFYNTPYKNTIKTHDQAITYFNIFSYIALLEVDIDKARFYYAFENLDGGYSISSNTVRLYIGRLMSAGFLVETKTDRGKFLRSSQMGDEILDMIFSKWLRDIKAIVLISNRDIIRSIGNSKSVSGEDHLRNNSLFSDLINRGLIDDMELDRNIRDKYRSLLNEIHNAGSDEE